ncbi:DUF1178 family protein [Roseovarius sp. SCSIO 43702]|uniref:DUF1178 family protein n=1 Tax=Roseovarius sp. SCSIO 43702 TaxID=2823043 RepID=UPI001C73AB1B|nr:DUF1178 family protein [Roseovarius sp. SCSIO 43702]QYX56075.1 DUF1178 family protein [Roseovarius sp. SCSIO 43702]
MIKFTLRCPDDHRFESWFKSDAAYDALRESGHISCAVCGSTDVEKALMAPRVQESRARPARPEARPTPETMARAIAEIRKHVEANSDYVGGNFAREARDMHEGVVPERAIHGEARPEEARRLIEDGVPIAPLPFTPKARIN